MYCTISATALDLLMNHDMMPTYLGMSNLTYTNVIAYRFAATVGINQFIDRGSDRLISFYPEHGGNSVYTTSYTSLATANYHG